jgi:hypothetical protein
MGPGVEQEIQSNTSSHERFGSLFQRMRGGADQPGINRRIHAMIDPLLMPCQCCGTPFVADPEAFIEVDMVRRPATAEEIRQFEEEGAEFLTPEKLEAMSEYELGEIGLTIQDRTRLLAGQEITAGAHAVCRACRQNRSAA